jgi:hypothetical protein
MAVTPPDSSIVAAALAISRLFAFMDPPWE